MHRQTKKIINIKKLKIMKTINLNKEEKVVLVLTKSEIITLCTGLSTLRSKYLQEDNYEMFKRTLNLYDELFEFQF